MQGKVIKMHIIFSLWSHPLEITKLTSHTYKLKQYLVVWLGTECIVQTTCTLVVQS